jgi:TPR repeat protein
MRLFRQSADKGYPIAAFNIGLLYADGEGVKVDKPQARVWFQKAAAGGNQLAIARLARIDAECSAAGRAGGLPGVSGERAGRPAC